MRVTRADRDRCGHVARVQQASDSRQPTGSLGAGEKIGLLEGEREREGEGEGVFYLPSPLFVVR